MTSRPVIYCAIDTTDIDHAARLAAAVAGAGCGIKLGMEFFNAFGPDGVRRVQDAVPGLSLFLDLKYHDIPNTVAGAVRAACALAPDYLNVHASGGLEMMRAAQDALGEEAARRNIAKPGLLAVTVLTSLDAAALARAGQGEDVAAQVRRLALLTQEAGLEGVVCSAHEIETLRAVCDPSFVLMVPGIRPAGTAGKDDQKRVMTPGEARVRGATHLVIGRPITGADHPAQMAAELIRQACAA